MKTHDFLIMNRLLFLATFLFPGVAMAQISVGSMLPDSPLTGMQGGQTSAHALLGAQGGAFVFWSNDCNWTDQYEDRIQALNNADVPIILVNSNDGVTFPKEAEAGKQYAVRYVRDSGGDFARALGAERTPHVFVFDSAMRLVYSGGIDDSPSDPGIVQANWLRDAVAQLSSGQAVSVAPTTPFGCRIKLP